MHARQAAGVPVHRRSSADEIHEENLLSAEMTICAEIEMSGSHLTVIGEDHSDIGPSDQLARREENRDRLLKNQLVAPLVVVVAVAAVVAVGGSVCKKQIAGLMVVAGVWIQMGVWCKVMQVARVCGAKTWLSGTLRQIQGYQVVWSERTDVSIVEFPVLGYPRPEDCCRSQRTAVVCDESVYFWSTSNFGLCDL